MKKNYSYQQKLTFSFLVIFTLFTFGIVIFEQERAKKYKTEALEERLDAYADLVQAYLIQSNGSEEVDSLLSILPANMRLTLVASDGTVTYDNLFPDPTILENHATRSEIQQAKAEGKGTFIRTSSSNNHPYLYYAKPYNNLYVRVALPYDIQVQSFLKPDNGFLYFVIGLFIIGFLFIHFIGGRFGKSVRQLRDFSLAVNDDAANIKIPHFPKDELGEIGEQIVKDYSKVKHSELQLKREREKLLQHVQSSAEGICFFNPDQTVAFYNGLFLQYLNTLSRDTILSLNDLMEEDVFSPVKDFLKDRHDDNYFETRINRQGKEFLVHVNIFEDNSFEIILNDITNQEKPRKLKQEMTGNIAHELRTPVTSIRGFLETMLENDLGHEKERDFLTKAYNQTKTLSELISDMSLLTKIDQGAKSFSKKNVNITDIINQVKSDAADALDAKNIVLDSFVPDNIIINGNENLLYSIFRNLTDNVIKHAGENIRIIIRKCDEKDDYVYFSFADTGVGIEDTSRLNRLFERFYRINDGRTRDTGGSGLGLSIVKNAVLFHGGNITVKTMEQGGLEFLFSLHV